MSALNRVISDISAAVIMIPNPFKPAKIITVSCRDRASEGSIGDLVVHEWENWYCLITRDANKELLDLNDVMSSMNGLGLLG